MFFSHKTSWMNIKYLEVYQDIFYDILKHFKIYSFSNRYIYTCESKWISLFRAPLREPWPMFGPSLMPTSQKSCDSIGHASAPDFNWSRIFNSVRLAGSSYTWGHWWILPMPKPADTHSGWICEGCTAVLP
jgi:hypothetical protein